MSIDDLKDLIILAVFIFIILFITFLLIFKAYYKKLLSKYFYLTGEKSLEGVHNKAQKFMNDDNISFSSGKFRKFLNNKFLYVILSVVPMVIYFIAFIDGVISIINHSYNWENDPLLVIIQLVLGFSFFSMLLVLCIRQVKLKLKHQYIILIANIISIVILIFLINFTFITSIYLLILIIFLVLDLVVESWTYTVIY